ncbi:hypothetical protein OAL67_01205, partial [bacterium]|nr:hypothetical protein [bacterium]
LKTENVTQNAYFKVYAVSPDGMGGQTITLVGQSPTLTLTNDWTELTLEFVANVENILGVYLDVGLDGDGIIWADAVTITESLNSVSAQFIVGSDGEHTVEYYSIDRAGNPETPDSVSFKIDQTPPGNWHDSGAFRGFFGAAHELYVYTVVEDATSGLSTLTDKYQYLTKKNPTFGRFSNLLGCNSTWQEDGWAILISPPFIPGVNSAYLLTPKTDFCDNDWKVCKTVTFYSEDLAGNSAAKDYCLNGPWIEVRGEGIVRANQNIDMLSEPEEDNTDGLIELGGNSVNFFYILKRLASAKLFSADNI